MNAKVILDTGPLVAAFAPRDAYHDWAVERWRQTQPPMITCEAVLSEAAFLLQRIEGAGNVVIQLFRRGVIDVLFRLRDQIEPIDRLMHRYRSQPMSLADACLVRLAELYDGSPVFTLDSDFRIYRKHNRRTIPLIMPDDR